MFLAQFAGSLSCAGADMPARPLARYAGNAGHGVFVVTTTVSGSVTLTLSMFESVNTPRRAGRLGFAPRNESMLSLIASASTGVPSWNCTPGRSPIVHSSYVAFGVIDFARYGTYLPLLLIVASGS